MRVTNNSLRDAFLAALQRSQRDLEQTQTQISTGSKINRPSDDPLAAARLREIEASLSRLDQYRSNAGVAQNRLGIEEESLVSVVNALQRIRELAIEANSATASPESRHAIATELRGLSDQVLALANSTDAEGRYIFAGFSEKTQPFARAGGGSVTYSGDDGQHMLRVSEQRLVATGDPGASIFQHIKSGNGTFSLAAAPGNTGTGVLGAGTVFDPAAWVVDTYSLTFVTAADYEVRDSGGNLVAAGTFSAPQSIAFRGVQIDLDGEPAAGDAYTVTPSTDQSMFATIDNLIAAIDAPASAGAGQALLNNSVGQAIVDLDQTIGRVLDVRAEIGSRLRALDAETSLNDGFAVQLSETLSDIRDVDYAEAISRLSQQLLGLEASQQAFVRLQGLSLFRFL